MAVTLTARWTYAVTSLLLLVRPSEAAADCPRTCFCNADNKIVHCARRGLSRIPTDSLPADSLQINLNGNVFASTALVRANFSRYSALEHLYLNECGIEALAVDTFADLGRLKWLDLSHNRIHELHDRTFGGLRLDHLFLNGNRRLRLGPASFAGLRTTALYLDHCALSRITAAQLAPLNGSLRSLHLHDNRLTRLEPALLPLFAGLDHLKIGANPLHCSCETAWLKAFYDAHARTLFSDDQPTCWTPPPMTGRRLGAIPARELRCRPPVFSNIDARIGGAVGRLRCTATGDPAPTLYWIRPTGTTRRYRPPADRSARFNEGVLLIRADDPPSASGARSGPSAGMYICVAHNEAGNVTLTLNVSWPAPAATSQPPSPSPPPPQTKLKPTSSVAAATAGDAPRSTTLLTRPPPVAVTTSRSRVRTLVVKAQERGHNYTSSQAMLELCRRRQAERVFNVTEMVGAVVGTHVCTLLLCLVFMPFYYKRRWRRHRHDSLEKTPHPDETRYLNELRHYVDNNALKR